ncbi:MAG: SCO family protein [Rhodospirillaceae bacterium]|nr:SCO family protein [Rhodospirillaceae bacterium]MBT5297032.1 SCO family protein [Rhodospirillaceae bacterium]MBT5516238.1 SCO family protein [Rhodospirillaceae bacterium]MBT6085259.1 SCO family protein [Rhodospirillaceae bacterium]MBT7247910.1 SCO family protein [Rhodospirillaceae bacterium]
MSDIRLTGLIAILLLVAVPAWAHGEAPKAAPAFDRDAAFKASRAAIGNITGNYKFRDRAGQTVKLAAFRGKPLIISLIYTSCPHFCPMITQAVAKAAEIANDALGKGSFNIVSIGFDTAADTPARMASFARTQGLDAANWEFLSADRKSVDALARDLGFAFAASPNGYDHLAQTTIIDADGKVFNQVYGTQFESPFLVEPMKDLVFGRASQMTSLDGLINRVRLFCTVYDPATGRYGFDYSLFIVIGVGSLCLFGVGFVVVRAWLHSRPAIRQA